jgi:hypothetical protein
MFVTVALFLVVALFIISVVTPTGPILIRLRKS